MKRRCDRDVAGEGTVDRDMSVPYRGERLRGDALARQLDTWVTAGVIEPSCADAVRAVIANPDWLDLTDQRIVVLGAGAEMGPTQSLLRWGADVVAVDLPRPAVWSRLVGDQSSLRRAAARPGPRRMLGPLVERAGADLLHDLPDVAAWLLGIGAGQVPGALTVEAFTAEAQTAGSCSATTSTPTVPRTSASRWRSTCSALTSATQRPDTALAFLATPTDAFAVPSDAVDQAVRAYERKTTISRVRRPLRVLSAGRLLRRNYAPGSIDFPTRVPLRASATVSCRSRVRTTRWRNGCNGGGRRRPGRPARRSVSRSRRRRGPARC